MHGSPLNCPDNLATLHDMESKKISLSGTRPTARLQAEQYGIDGPLIDINFEKTPYERLQNHDQALRLAKQVREAMEHRRDHSY